MADADGSSTFNGDELAMLLSYLNLEPSGDCADRLKELLSQSLGAGTGGISFEEFYFKWLKDCLPDWHVWRDCPPSAPPSPPPPSPPPPPPSPPPSPSPPKSPCQNFDGRRLTSDDPCVPGMLLSFGITANRNETKWLLYLVGEYMSSTGSGACGPLP
eukprot:scaffold27758_cov33-Phaeocystis_antarctica.AAC.1